LGRNQYFSIDIVNTPNCNIVHILTYLHKNTIFKRKSKLKWFMLHIFVKCRKNPIFSSYLQWLFFWNFNDLIILKIICQLSQISSKKVQLFSYHILSNSTLFIIILHFDHRTLFIFQILKPYSWYFYSFFFLIFPTRNLRKNRYTLTIRRVTALHCEYTQCEYAFHVECYRKIHP